MYLLYKFDSVRNIAINLILKIAKISQGSVKSGVIVKCESKSQFNSDRSEYEKNLNIWTGAEKTFFP